MGSKGRTLGEPISDDKLERWRLWHEEVRRDLDWQSRTRELETRRAKIRPEILDLLTEFLERRISLEDFRRTFDRNTRNEWDASWGFKGFSGGGFLNTLVKYVSDQDALAEELRFVLGHASHEGDAYQKMASLGRYLENLISRGEVTKRQIQPARIAFFVPIWWHVKDPQAWPIFFPSHRRRLEDAGIYRPTHDPVDDYFSFRAQVRLLASALSITPSQLGFLCWWLEEKRFATVVAPSEDDIHAVLSSALVRLRKFNQRYRTRPAPSRRRMVTEFDRPSQARTDLISIVGTDCQICGAAAFMTESGSFYVEAHHLDELARRNRGNLCTESVLVVCPTCHAKLHYAKKRIMTLPDGSLSIDLAGQDFRALPNTEARLEQLVKQE